MPRTWMASSGTESDVVDVALRNGEDELADPARGEEFRRDPSHLGIYRPTGVKRLESVGEASGSTPMTLILPLYHAAMPPIRPPPPTGISRVSIPGASSSSSIPMVPWPSRVSV